MAVRYQQLLLSLCKKQKKVTDKPLANRANAVFGLRSDLNPLRHTL